MKALVIGASGGIGRAFATQLAERDSMRQVIAACRRGEAAFAHPKVAWRALDVTDEASVAGLAAEMSEVDWLVYAAGVLHTPGHGPEKALRQLDADFLLLNMQVNALGTLLVARHFAPAFRHRRPARFAAVSAKVGSVTDNRLGGWYSYRMSKAALNMGLKTLAIEWLPNVCVAALHPGTTDTALSRPFQANVPEGGLFPPERSVGHMLEILDRLGPEDSGRFWSWDGSELPW